MTLATTSFLIAFAYLACWGASARAQQRTVGLLQNSTESYNGYTLFAPTTAKTTYLIDNCGRVVKTWTSAYEPGQTVYLQEDGTLFHSARTTTNKTFSSAGGAGGRVERYDWDGNLLWGYNYSSATYYQHHDAIMLPSGNILLLSWDLKTQTEALAAGRKSSLIPTDGSLWSEKIVELKPVGKDSAVVVWEWKVWEHLIQDADTSKANYGAVSDHPELLDVNFLNNPRAATDWLHFNGFAYNAELDQIVVSSRQLSEIFIIDHSTTTAQAASHAGGKYGKGGDILYRWGNPQSYRRGASANRTLYGQHNPHWIDKGLSGAGNILIYNNGDERPEGAYSTIEEIQPPLAASGTYSLETSAAYLPKTSLWTYKASNPTSFYSGHISGAQRLPNGNTLICEGAKGNLFEVTSAGKTVWQYKNPVGVSGIASQGTAPSRNEVFRALRYGPSFAAFKGRTLTAGAPVELNPGSYDCTITTGVQAESPAGAAFAIAPNPASTEIIIRFVLERRERVRLALYDALGREAALLLDEECAAGERFLTVTNAQMPQADGAYFLRLQTPVLYAVQMIRLTR